MTHTVYLGLGSNIGHRKQTIHQAIELIKEKIGDIERQSSLYETKPWGFESPNDFINAVVRCATTLTPREVLHAANKIEQQLGRTAKSDKGCYGDRTIDIDILFYDDITLKEDDLQIPHPHINERDFVLKPLKEIGYKHE